MLPVAFLAANFRWLLAGFLMAFASSFGQTYYIALFSGHLRAAFELSHGAFGSLYALATLAAAASLVWVGKLADRQRLFTVVAVTLMALTVVMMSLSVVNQLAYLLITLYGLRLLGQGMISHLAVTAMGRWFDQERGRSLSIASLGYTSGEFVLPTLVVFLIGFVGWRASWLVAGGFVLVILLPAILLCLRVEPQSASVRSADGKDPATTKGLRAAKRSWSRKDVLKMPLFYLLMVCMTAPAFIITGTFFNQVLLADLKAWPLDLVAKSFMAYAMTQLITVLVVGYLIDKLSAVALLPWYLWPLVGAMLTIAFGSGTLSLFLMMVLIGVTAAASATLFGAIWAELFGTDHLGSIRALTMAAMVVFSALSPGLIGFFLDLGVGFDVQAAVMALYTALASITLLILQGRLRRLAAN